MTDSTIPERTSDCNSAAGRGTRDVYGYVADGAPTLLAAAVEWVLGIDTERRSLEDVTTPLTAEGPDPVEADLRPDAGHRTPPAPAWGRQLQARE